MLVSASCPSNSLPRTELQANQASAIRKQWRRDHPFGFYAKPLRTAQGVLDLKHWECGIPGKDQTPWEGGLFKLDVAFPEGERPSCHFSEHKLICLLCRVSYQATKVYGFPIAPMFADKLARAVNQSCLI